MHLRTFALSIAISGVLSVTACDAGFLVSAQTGTRSKLDVGVFDGGSVFNIRASGIISLGGGAQFYADGSLSSLYPSGSFYAYANPGATNYPTLFGGDGINHFAGGGANYDLTGAGFGDAGKMTTDTTDPSAIRHGALIGTFADTPSRGDWFLIGLARTIVIPGTSSHLYLAVSDTDSSTNSGSYTVSLEPSSAVPEPGGLILCGIGAMALALRARMAKQAR